VALYLARANQQRIEVFVFFLLKREGVLENLNCSSTPDGITTWYKFPVDSTYDQSVRAWRLNYATKIETRTRVGIKQNYNINLTTKALRNHINFLTRKQNLSHTELFFHHANT
jgi:hypothetical protein